METITGVSVPVVQKNQGAVLVPRRQASTDSIPMPKKSSEGTVDQQLARVEAKRLERLRQAANTFAISDQRFTIYKDTTGQFITRFTSLRDGKVTYIPEPDMVSWLNQSKGSFDASMSLDI